MLDESRIAASRVIRSLAALAVQAGPGILAAPASGQVEATDQELNNRLLRLAEEIRDLEILQRCIEVERHVILSLDRGHRARKPGANRGSPVRPDRGGQGEWRVDRRARAEGASGHADIPPERDPSEAQRGPAVAPAHRGSPDPGSIGSTVPAYAVDGAGRRRRDRVAGPHGLDEGPRHLVGSVLDRVRRRAGGTVRARPPDRELQGRAAISPGPQSLLRSSASAISVHEKAAMLPSLCIA